MKRGLKASGRAQVNCTNKLFGRTEQSDEGGQNEDEES